MTKTFTGILEYYIVSYTAKEVGYSRETIRSYYTAIEQYVLWICKTQGICVPDIDVSCFDKDLIRAFLINLEDNEHVSISTRNQRRAAIVSFLEYAQNICPLYANAYVQAKAIKAKKAPKPKKSFLTIDEYKIMLSSIDIHDRNGLMHYLLLSVLYDTAARVNETVNMNFEDFSFGKENSVVIFGKGSKYRRIYLTSHTVKLLKDYSARQDRHSGALFLNKDGNRISDSGIDYILKKYALSAAETMLSLKEKTVSPHTIRRSKATHMLLNGASLPVIQRFLGHESITTTEEYLDAGTEAMIKAIEEAEAKMFTSGVKMPELADWHDENVLRRLKMIAR
ncbi:MAG: tyrosine-type recombinase/integrase [Spirochaetales bacterium]|jgi:integrase/recombinase XerD|nr:tyrosine-type recombinase/integrase [Spirochaetales bacterium]